ncbi:T9SS type B sorting domain-containing protein [Flavobacterium caseinilyticum]|uniref:T9SS type B sorting domain-containing protein n=1 Tax=Flavobacterium caseinilyticum TaxID=2541732 RepID=A0A4R5AZ67_9FLAO|nr:choice-of-anchor L domain-containing protein [Flavobacterium caseinilyticum]TDD77489.1 T9SS type B sorting domain-containing protein [Flavobacterium caseinilyticum]
MKYVKIISLYFFISCAIFSATAQPISVNESYSAKQLVEDVLVNSSCANVSNFSVTGKSFSTSQNSYGYFNNQGGSFPFTEGVLLSTWGSKNSIGPFVRSLGGGDSPWPGDADLENALGITNTINATVLEFDFKALTDFISFDYIFASNEYQDDFPCNYSDGFAFLIKEINTSTYSNLALLPGTTIPVSSKSIHPQINALPNSTEAIKSCGPENEFYFGGFNTFTSPINYAGQTKVLTAQKKVEPGKTYHIKLVIADQRNQYYDSAVFLKAGSFSPKIDLGPDRLFATNNPICFGESYTIAPNLPSGYPHKWFKNNVEFINNSPTYTVTTPGIYRVEVLITPSCIATEEITIEYTPEIVLSDATLIQCDDNSDGLAIFDLKKADAIIKNSGTNLSPVVYYESMNDANTHNNPIANPSAYASKTINQSVFAKVSNSFECANYAEVKLRIANNSILVQNPISTCDEDGVEDGMAGFNLNSQVTPQIVTGLPAGLIVEYYLNQSDAIANLNPLPNNFRNTVAYQQTIYSKIMNGTDCYAITPVTLVVNTFGPANFQDETLILCEGFSVNLSVDAGFANYLWSTGALTNAIMVDTPGIYSVIITNANGCQITKKYTVTASGIATITGVAINDFAGNQNSIVIEYTGNGTYEFSIDGSFFQENPQFNAVPPGEYFVYARDKNGCGSSVPFVVYILDYPRYFTPNNDGYNDVWQVKNLEKLPNSSLYIYDRYGKLLKQLTTSDIGWNGIVNDFVLPADDYWFHLKLENGRIIKGHFSLKR